MRQTLFILLLSLFATAVSAQITLNPHKRNLNKAEKRNGDALRGGADFVIDPIEQVPVKRNRNASAASQSNWGKDLLLPAALRERLLNECTYRVVVKIADTGQSDHTATKQGQLPGANYTTDANVNDGNGHGTHVVGIVAADELGLCDVLVDKGLLKHKAVKILSNTGSGSFDWVKNAIAAERADDLAIKQSGGFVVWNGSFGGGSALIDNVEAELKKSTDAGIFFCFAAGNTGQVGVNYPGNGKYSIACASLDQSGVRSSYSTIGPEVWSAMPGRNINSTYKGGYAQLSGTSMATPFLTAVSAIALSKWGPGINNLERMKAYLAWCAKDILPTGKDSETGWGMELIANILDRNPTNTPGLPTNPPPPPPPATGSQSVSPLVVSLSKEYDINWDNLTVSGAQAECTTFKTGGRGAKKSNQNLALKTVKVRFDISFTSTGEVGTEAAKIEKAVANYFAFRGFMLAKGQDESFAAVWSGYFLEMGLLQLGYKNAEVVKISHVSGGVPVVHTGAVLKHFPPRA